MIQNKVIPNEFIKTALLIVNGFLIALMLSLAKEVTSAGVHPVVYAFWQTLLAGTLLLAISLKNLAAITSNHVRYFFISGLTGIAVPNAIAFVLVTKIGSGFTGIMYALPPIFTFLISITMGLASFKVHKLIGLFVAVFACCWLVMQRHESMGEATTIWLLLGLVIPFMLSIGNVYRSVAWPEGIQPLTLAAGTLLAASFILHVYGNVISLSFILDNSSNLILSLILLQGFLTALTFFCSFELQKRSDPVFYSQLGSVAAVFGLLIGVLFSDERYAYSIWVGVAVLLAGLRVSNLPSFNVTGYVLSFKKLPRSNPD